MERNDFKIEICSGSVLSCIAARDGGADRVELCAGMPEGGTTPSCGMIRRSREVLGNVGLNVIIRPRGGDFLYSDSEIRQMEYDIYSAQDAGADGLVFGALTEDGEVDERAMTILMTAAGDLPVTFHRAFDHTCRPLHALERIIGFGCRRILTSGCMPTAYEGTCLLKELVAAAGDRISIMPGSGVNSGNIAAIAAETGAHEFHFSARKPAQSRMKFRRPEVVMGGETDFYTVMETDSAEVAAAAEALLKCQSQTL